MSIDALHSSPDVPGRSCPRCGFSIELDTGQCDNCGELFIPTTPLSRKSMAAQIREGLHAKPQPAQIPRTVGPPPVAVIFRIAALAVAACLGVALVFYGLAWLGTGLTLTFLRISTGAVLCSGAVILVAFTVTVCWRIIYSVEVSLTRWAGQRDAKLEMQLNWERLTLKDKLSEKPKPTVRPAYEYRRPKKQRGRPGPPTLVFSVLAIISATLAAFLSVIPFFGFISFMPLFSAGCCTIIALVLCHYEQSERLLPFIALGLMILALLALIGQFFLWGATVGEINKAVEQVQEEKRIQQQKLDRDLVNDSLDRFMGLIPTPKPKP